MLYGLSLEALAWQMGKTPDETAFFLAEHEERFPQVHQWMRDVIAEASVQGYITLWSGRRWESLPGLEYQAINAYIQGSSADLTNLALIRVSNYLKKTGYGRVLSQIHDEILFSINNMECVPTLKSLMELESLFNIAFTTDVEIGY